MKYSRLPGLAGTLALFAALLVAGCGQAPAPVPWEARGPCGEALDQELPLPGPGSGASIAMGADTAKALAALDDEDWEVRDRAVRILVKAGPSAVPLLLGRLKAGENPDRNAEILFCLEQIGAGGREEVEAHLRTAKTFDETVFALRALGVLGNKESAGLLRPYLSWTPPKRKGNSGYLQIKMDDCRQGKIRNQAAESLVRLGFNEGMPVLIEGLRGNGWVRRDAIVSLRRLSGCTIDFGYTIDGSRPERDRAIAKWEAWWKENSRTFKPAFAMKPAVWRIYYPRKK